MRNNIFSVKIVFIALAFILPRPEYLTTIHPFQAILQSVVGSRGAVNALLKSGGSPHAFELLPSDVVKAGRADALCFGSKDLDG